MDEVERSTPPGPLYGRAQDPPLQRGSKLLCLRGFLDGGAKGCGSEKKIKTLLFILLFTRLALLCPAGEDRRRLNNKNKK